MKKWQGNWIIGVAFGHTVFALIMFANDYLSLFEHGLINSISSDREAAAVWFILFGQVLFIIGLLIKHLEYTSDKPFPLSISINLLLMTIVGVVLMPASGFWLIFPPVIAMLLAKPVLSTQALSES